MALTEGERLLYIIDALGVSQAEFSRKCGITTNVISRLVNGTGGVLGVRLTPTYINRICNAYPTINRQFLEDGESYPGDISLRQVKERYEKEIDELKKINESLRKSIDAITSLISK